MRWLGHVQGVGSDRLIKRAGKGEEVGKGRTGRARLRWEDSGKQDKRFSPIMATVSACDAHIRLGRIICGGSEVEHAITHSTSLLQVWLYILSIISSQ